RSARCMGGVPGGRGRSLAACQLRHDPAPGRRSGNPAIGRSSGPSRLGPWALTNVTEVVVTGISSFVGHHLARRFALRGDHVIGTISRPRDRYQGIEAQRIAAIEPYVEIFGLDLREPREFAALVDRRAPSLWIHHAGFAADYASPDYDLETAHV